MNRPSRPRQADARKLFYASLAVLLTTGCATPNAPDEPTGALRYDPSVRDPFGLPNPDAPPELAEFAFLAGNHNCLDERRSADGATWVKNDRLWDGRYTMNGFAIIDSGGVGGSANGNMRVYDATAGKWNVTFFSMPTYSSGVWQGNKVADDSGAGYSMVLSQPQNAPGMQREGVSRLTFSEISESGFNWIGEWVSKDGSIVYPFWKISCTRVGARE